jgi:hypothetical protein
MGYDSPVSEQEAAGERRKTRRRTAAWRATWKVDPSASGACEVLDVGGGGLGIKPAADSPRPQVGDAIAVDIQLARDVTLTVAARVVHVDNERIGMVFVRLLPSDAMILAAYVAGRPMPT